MSTVTVSGITSICNHLVFLPSGSRTCTGAAFARATQLGGLISNGAISVQLSTAGLYKTCLSTRASPALDDHFEYLSATQLFVINGHQRTFTRPAPRCSARRSPSRRAASADGARPHDHGANERGMGQDGRVGARKDPRLVRQLLLGHMCAGVSTLQDLRQRLRPLRPPALPASSAHVHRDVQLGFRRRLRRRRPRLGVPPGPRPTALWTRDHSSHVAR